MAKNSQKVDSFLNPFPKFFTFGTVVRLGMGYNTVDWDLEKSPNVTIYYTKLEWGTLTPDKIPEREKFRKMALL